MKPESEIAKAILKLAEVHDKRGEEIAEALGNVAYNVKCLGNGNAATQMGAIEGLAMMIKQGLDGVSSGITEGPGMMGEFYEVREGLEKVAEDISDGLSRLSASLEDAGSAVRDGRE